MARPFIHVNFAAEGACAREDADRRQPPPDGSGRVLPSISCSSDWRRVHALREQYDAIAVGGKTWNIDRPRLNVRIERLGREPLRQPSKIIFAGLQPCTVPDSGAPVFVIGLRHGTKPGVTVLTAPDHDLREPLKSLYRHGIQSILVEGGPTLLRSFFNQGCVDVVTVFVRARTAEAADRGAREVLDGLPPALSTSSFGEGFLLESRRTLGPAAARET